MPDRTAPAAEHSAVIPMFPTLVWKVQLQPAVRAAIDSSVLPFITRLRMGSPPLPAGRGWQSVQDLHSAVISCPARTAPRPQRFASSE